MTTVLWLPKATGCPSMMEGDFRRLNLCDIEDMMLLLVQKKLSNLKKDVIFDLNVALWMFTRRVVILKWVEDLQLGVKSYLKKLNITKMETFMTVLHDIASNMRMDYSHHNQGHRQAAARKKVDTEFREVRWWERIRRRLQAA
ncbi:hypothetical protein Tco_1054167 [Tanacetum coccineum]|uniref:Uncharacterized protein n=1 Tax=Tanacetum coccineum TaxID=301880 RepID=A0ABQ5GWN1_9ASTR